MARIVRGMRTKYNITIDSALPAFRNAMISDLAAGLKTCAEVVMTDSKDNYVPVVSGALYNSGFVEPPEFGRQKVLVRIGFGGGTTAYALRVHEAPVSWGQGKNKYLTKPLKFHISTFPSLIQQAVQSRVASREAFIQGKFKKFWWKG